MNVLFVALGIYGREGGIERFNRRLVRCLAELPATTGRVTVLSLWDTAADGAAAPSGISFVAGHSSKLGAVGSFVALLVRRRPSVVAFGHVLLGSLALASAALRPQARRILFVHGIEVWDRPGRLRRWLVGRWIHTVVAVSDHTATRMATLYRIPRTRFVILNAAIDPPAVGATAAGSASLSGSPAAQIARPPQLLTVSRLTRADDYKRIDEVIRGLPTILARHPTAHYVIVGDGDWRADLEALAASLGVADRVRFMGEVEDAVRDELYANSDVFVLPSTKEGFGIVFLEAWAHGRPVVCAADGAAPDLVWDEVDGLVVRPAAEAIAAAVIRLLDDPDLRERLGSAGHALVMDRYTHERFRERLLAVLEA